MQIKEVSNTNVVNEWWLGIVVPDYLMVFLVFVLATHRKYAKHQILDWVVCQYTLKYPDIGIGKSLKIDI